MITGQIDTCITLYKKLISLNFKSLFSHKYKKIVFEISAQIYIFLY